jgi:hypothetical protein
MIRWEDVLSMRLTSQAPFAKLRLSRLAVMASDIRSQSAKETFLFDEDGKWFVAARSIQYQQNEECEKRRHSLQ